MTPTQNLQRLAKQKGQRSNFDDVCRDIERYIMPLTSNFSRAGGGENSKTWDTREIWDSTAPIGAQRLASMYYSSMFNPAARWFNIGFRNPILKKEKEAQTWIEICTALMYEAIVASNFGLEMASGIYSMVGFGNTCITVEPVNPTKWEGIDFSAVPLEEMEFEEDWKGRPRISWRTYSWTAGQIISKFADPETGEVHPTIPNSLKKEEAEGSTTKHEVVFSVWPREGAAPMKYGEKVRAPKARPFAFQYILKEGAVALGEEGGYFEMPVFIGRWDKAVGSKWGFGPGALALPTVKLINAWLEAITDAAEKAVDPATIVTERGLLSDLNLRKGGKTVVRRLDDISTYESKARFDVSEMMLADMRNMVRKHFREDDLTLKDSPAMTATEAQLRVELLNRLFGATVGRTNNDLSDPMLQLVFNMMYRAERFPPPPPSVLATNPAMQIEYLGPFMRSQRTDEVAAIERLFSAVAAAKKMGFEDASDAFNAGGAVREMAERLSTPAACLNSVAEAKAMADNRAKMQKAAQTAEVMRTAAEGDKAAAQAQATAAPMMQGGMSGPATA